VQGYLAFDDDVAHLEYAVTWFGLAITLVVTAYLRLWRIRGDAEDTPPSS
jgi:cytochrome oxidase assembly protein ShyY1